MAEAPATDDPPRWARIAHAASLLELMLLASAFGWCGIARDSAVALCLMAPCVAAFVGMRRRVVWGRALFSCVSILLAVSCAAFLIAAYTDDQADSLPPLEVRWLMVTGITALLLALPVLVGWRRHWFKRGTW